MLQMIVDYFPTSRKCVNIALLLEINNMIMIRYRWTGLRCLCILLLYILEISRQFEGMKKTKPTVGYSHHQTVIDIHR